MCENVNLQFDSSTGLNPLFEQVFVIRVAPGAYSNGALTELPRIGVDEDRHQSFRLWKVVNALRHFKGQFLIEKCEQIMI